MAKHKTQPSAEDWISVQEAAQIANFHVEYVRRLIRSGTIEGRKIIIVWQVSRSSLMEYLERQAARGERTGRPPTRGT